MDERQDRPPEIRLSNAEREFVITQLREATDEGRISLLEFEERAGQAYAATFPSELVPLTADLPIHGTELPAPKPPVQDVTATRSYSPTATHWAVQVMGGNERRGKWQPGGHTRAITVMGGQVLDLTEVDAREVNITAISVMGGAEIIVPDGATVDFGGFILFGGTSNEATAQGDSEMVVRIRAYGAMGGCGVRNLKRRERKKRGLPPR